MLTPRFAASRADGRAGFSLIEMLVAIVLFALVGATLVGALVQEQRFFGDATAVVGVRTAVRQLTEILPTELRAASPPGGDIYSMSDTSVSFRSSFGATIICTIDVGRTAVTVPPRLASASAGFTWWIQTPVVGDSVLLYDAGNTLTSKDDQWRRFEIRAVASGALCPTLTGYTRSAGESTAGWSFTVSPALPPSIAPGAAMRFFRPVRYGLYQASDGRWYAGYRDCVAGRVPACTSYAVVAGPFLAPGAAGGGIRLQYFDSSGAAIAVPGGLSLVRLSAHSETERAMRASGFAAARVGDSLLVNVALRNRQ